MLSPEIQSVISRLFAAEIISLVKLKVNTVKLAVLSDRGRTRLNTQRYNIKDLIKSKERRAWMQMDDYNRCETVRGLMRDHMGKLMSMKSMEGLEKVELKEITSGKHHQKSLVVHIWLHKNGKIQPFRYMCQKYNVTTINTR